LIANQLEILEENSCSFSKVYFHHCSIICSVNSFCLLYLVRLLSSFFRYCQNIFWT